MPPLLALALWLVCLVLLFRYDPAREPKTSTALWVPVIWMCILGSRNPSAWFSGSGNTSAQGYEEGSPVDRIIYLALIALAIWILTSRHFRWTNFLLRNIALFTFVLLALVSACWSDEPFTCLRRWFRDLGGYFIVLVVLSDPRPKEALATVLRWTCYLLISLSILLDKYFPFLSRHWDPWTGVGSYEGVTTGKNLLGAVALISSIFFIWDSVRRWRERKQKRIQRVFVVNAAFLAMSLSLLRQANSTTTLVCFALGCLVILAVQSKVLRRRPMLLKVLIPGAFCLYLILAVGLGMSGEMAQAVGKDPTLTDRTKIWQFLLNMHTNPILGTGYQSFWLGSRLEWFWNDAGLGHINEAHDGFLEVYLELGLIGLVLIVGILISGFRNICRRLSPFSDIAPFCFAVWLITLFYCVTEAGFETGLMWSVLMLTTISIPKLQEQRIRSMESPEEEKQMAHLRQEQEPARPRLATWVAHR